MKQISNDELYDLLVQLKKEVESAGALETNTSLYSNLLSDKISLHDLSIALGVTDERTAKRWCKNNNILVIKFGKNKYINRIDFELTIDRPFVTSLITKHPECWKEIYAAYKKRDFMAIAEHILQIRLITKRKFIVPGAAGNAFIERMLKKSK